MGKIIIDQGDITVQVVDAIVNAANTGLRGGGGVDGAIHRAAGPAVMEECRKIGSCTTGRAVITSAGNLKAKKIIHTPGPVWRGGGRGEDILLRSCYSSCFMLASRFDLKTIAFPAISTGIYGYPVETAARIALSEGMKYLSLFTEIRYICYSRNDLDIYNKIYAEMVSKQKKGQ